MAKAKNGIGPAIPPPGRNSDLDLKSSSLREVNEVLQSATAGEFIVRNPRGAHALAAGLEGDIGVSQTAIARLEAEIERRKLRAPIAGRLGQVAALRPGATVAEGERVALVVPKGELRVVSQFPVATAVGRVRAGQPARVRLDGFPFTAYGTLGASVSGIGTEAEDGLVRVELSVDGARSAAIPIQHGLTGVVEVEVERLSPASLVLRLAGRALQPGAAAPRFPVSGRG